MSGKLKKLTFDPQSHKNGAVRGFFFFVRCVFRMNERRRGGLPRPNIQAVTRLSLAEAKFLSGNLTLHRGEMRAREDMNLNGCVRQN